MQKCLLRLFYFKTQVFRIILTEKIVSKHVAILNNEKLCLDVGISPRLTPQNSVLKPHKEK